MTRITGTLHKGVFIFMKISCWILLRMRHVVHRVVEKIETHILCLITYFRESWSSWYSEEKYGRTWQVWDENITLRMRFACWITTAPTHTHTPTLTHSLTRTHIRIHTHTQNYVIIVAFPGQNCFLYVSESYVTRALHLLSFKVEPMKPSVQWQKGFFPRG
jgi:hypothetical protein